MPVGLIEQLEARERAMTVGEVAALLRLSGSAVYPLAATNRIPSFKIGAAVRFDPGDVANWLKSKMGKKPSFSP